MSDDAIELHLPNAHNCIQATLFQIGKGNYDKAEAFLRNAQRSLDKARN
jgi:cellobiose-specific phosphotransferase system component IIA